MPQVSDFVQWVNISAMGLITAIFLYAVVFYVHKLMPILNEIKENSERSSTSIDNNTRAFEELAKTNANVARALELLTTTLKANADDIKRHEQDSKANFDKAFDMLSDHSKQIGDLKTEVVKVSESVKLCTSITQMKMYHTE